MIPLRDENPSDTTPVVTIVIIVLNCLVFLFEATRSSSELQSFIQVFGLVPANLTDAPGTMALISVFSSMFLHAGWMHLIGNMWILWIFGDNIEDTLGHFRYFLFYMFCGVISGLAQVFMSPGSHIPQVGASGAIAGVLGGYIILFPHARVLTAVPIFYILRVFHVPAIVYLGIWILTQAFSGVASLGARTDETGGVAWWAHIGGFAIGAVLVKLLSLGKSKKTRPLNQHDYDRYY